MTNITLSIDDKIWNIIEDTKELSEQTKKEIEEARKRIESGEFVTHEEIKSEFGLINL
jgi:predicted transcriptional regulator